MPDPVAGRIQNERGVTYLLLLFAIVLIGISTTAGAKQWKVIVQRELEADLMMKGIEIQNALALYSATMKAGRVMPGEIYPQSLIDLTRSPKPYLRKAYMDPMTHGEWEYLRAPTGGIMGVRSRSLGSPFKKHDFPQAVRHFEGRMTYHDWIFQHPNPSSAGTLPAVTGAVPSVAMPSPAGAIPPGVVPNPGVGIPPQQPMPTPQSLNP